MPLRITEIEVGQTIDYRGAPATVALVWTNDADPRPTGIPEPMGMEIEWVDSNGVGQRTRLVWPDLNATERAELDMMDAEARAAVVGARLLADIDARTFELWSA